MYVHTEVHGKAHEQPLFSRAVNPVKQGAAQRKVPLIERRKRKMPQALNLEQIPQFRRRNPKHACILTAPPTHVRVAAAPAGPHYTLHRCVDVHTQEVFFHPEYTGPPGEEQQHQVQWPKVIELSSPMACSGAQTLRNAGFLASADTTADALSDDLTPVSAAGHDCSSTKQTEGKDEEVKMMPLIERRKRKMPAALDLSVLRPFKRRNPDQICVLEAPATHVRLHTVQAGPHHMMHQCLDAHTEEIFFLPEYVGPADMKHTHKVAWPQIINAAPKPAEHQQDVPFDQAVGAAVVSGVVGAATADVEVLSAVADVIGEVEDPLSVSSAAVCSADDSESCLSPYTPMTKFDAPLLYATTKTTTSTTIATITASAAPAACNGAEVAAAGGAKAMMGDGEAAGERLGLVTGGAGVNIVGGGGNSCSPGTPCNVAVATASLAARAVKVN